MQRIGHVWKIKPGRAEEYERRHATVWPELEAFFAAAGVRSYHIYRWGEILFSHMDVDDYAALMQRCDGAPIVARWEAAMADLIEYPNADPQTGWPERLRHVWSLGEEIS